LAEDAVHGDVEPTVNGALPTWSTDAMPAGMEPDLLAAVLLVFSDLARRSPSRRRPPGRPPKLAVRITHILLANNGCGSSGGHVFTDLVPVVWKHMAGRLPPAGCGRLPYPRNRTRRCRTERRCPER
jgi:hypothetical protein